MADDNFEGTCPTCGQTYRPPAPPTERNWRGHPITASAVEALEAELRRLADDEPRKA